MLELNKAGKSIKEIARIFEVSTRTVQRALKLAEEAQGIALPLVDDNKGGLRDD